MSGFCNGFGVTWAFFNSLKQVGSYACIIFKELEKSIAHIDICLWLPEDAGAGELCA